MTSPQPAQPSNLWLLLLPAVMFLAMIYAWLYFSRILIFVDETPVGEFCSFLLAVSAILAIAIAAAQRNVLGLGWLFVLALPVAAWILKCWQVAVTLRRQDKIHPLYLGIMKDDGGRGRLPQPVSWIVRTLIGGGSATVVAFVIYLVGLQVSRSVWHGEVLGPAFIVFLLLFVIGYFLQRTIHYFPRFADRIVDEMKTYKDEQLPQPKAVVPAAPGQLDNGGGSGQ